MKESASFWDAIDRLVASSRIVIRRPAGSRHPRYRDVTFLLDYGYLEGTTSPDGAGIDVWLGRGAGRTTTAAVVAIDLLKRDLETKILLSCTREDTAAIEAFHTTPFQQGWVISRPTSFPAAPSET